MREAANPAGHAIDCNANIGDVFDTLEKPVDLGVIEFEGQVADKERLGRRSAPAVAGFFLVRGGRRL